MNNRFLCFPLLMLALLPLFTFTRVGSAATGYMTHLPDQGVVEADNNGTFDPHSNYKIFVGRLSDRGPDDTVFKIKVENNNIKFFRSGDLVLFKENRTQEKFCKAYVHGIDDHYLTLYSHTLPLCRKGLVPLRRGAQLVLYSAVLEERIIFAGQYRSVLLKKKEDFLNQLNSINQKVFNFKNQKIAIESDFEKQILEIQAKKQSALNRAIDDYNYNLQLQKRLQDELHLVENNISFYQIERKEQIVDRWSQDLDSGLPVDNRPQAPLSQTENPLLQKRDKFLDL